MPRVSKKARSIIRAIIFVRTLQQTIFDFQNIFKSFQSKAKTRDSFADAIFLFRSTCHQGRSMRKQKIHLENKNLRNPFSKNVTLE